MIPGIMAGQVRAVAGGAAADPDFSSVALLVHFDGGNGSTSFVDVKGHALTPTNATQSDAQKLFGSSSLFGTASANGMVQTAQLADFNLVGKFTVEFALYLTSTTQQYFFVARGSSTLSIQTSGGKIQATIFGTNIIDTTAYPLNQWFRVRVTRDASNICRLFIEGDLRATSGAIATNHTGTTIVEFGGSHFWGGPTAGLRSGHMEELRVTPGVCRSVASYTPDVAAFPDS